MASGVLFGSAIPLIPVMAVTGQMWSPLQASWTMLLPIFYSIVINAIGYVLFITVVRREGPTFFSQFNYFAVLCGVAGACSSWAKSQRSISSPR